MNIANLLVKLKEFEKLKDNWNADYNSVKPTKESIEGTEYLLKEFLINKDLPEPFMCPVPNGNIQFEWSIYGIDLEIQIYSKTHFHVLFEMYEEPFVVGSKTNKLVISSENHITSFLPEFTTCIGCDYFLEAIKILNYRHIKNSI